MRKVLNILWILLQILIIIYVVTVTIYIVNKNSYGYTKIGDYHFSIIHKNNKDIINNGKIGDLLIIKKTHDIGKNNIIYYYSVNGNKYVVHSGKVEEVIGKGKNSLYQLEGEAKLSVVDSRVLGRKVTRIPKLGKIIEFLESRIGFLFCVLLPIMIIFIYHIFQLFVQIRYDEVEKE